MRSLRALLLRLGEAVLEDVGGCRLGSRNLDFHYRGFARLGAVVEESAVPVSPAAAAVLGRGPGLRAALAGGEDYELLFAARPEHEAQVRRLARGLRLPMSRIGQIVPRRQGVRLLTRAGRYVPFEELRGGYRHFPGDM